MPLPTRSSATLPGADGRPEAGSDGRSPERRRERRERPRDGRRPDAPSPSPDTRPPAPDTAAVDAARTRAIDRAPSTDRDISPEEEGGILGSARSAGAYMWGNGKEGLTQAAAASAALGYLGVRSGARGILYALDWFGRKLDSMGNSLIKKDLFLIKYLINPAVSILDWTAKKLGLEKSLYEQIQKLDEDKKKLAEKLLKELRDREKKAEKETDDKKKKEKRRKSIEDKLGKDVADAIIDDIDALDKRTTDKVDAKADKKDDDK